MSFIDRLFDKTNPGLVKTLDLTWRRNQAIVSNVSNAETPQYRAVDLHFAGELDRAFKSNETSLARTNPLHTDASAKGEAHLIQDYSGATKPDGNNVDIDIQMGRLASNSGKYSMAATLLRKKLGFLRLLAREAGR